MALEERLVGRDVLHADDAGGADGNHLVDQLHGVAVGQQFADAVHVHHRRLVGVVEGCLNLVLAYLLAHFAGKLVVDGVARTGGNDTALDGLANQRHITNNV